MAGLFSHAPAPVVAPRRTDCSTSVSFVPAPMPVPQSTSPDVLVEPVVAPW